MNDQATVTADTLHYLDSAAALVESLRLGLDYDTAAELTGPEMVEVADALTWAAKSLLHLTVAQQRLLGVEWSDIGAALDCTKQAAQQRFSSRS
jgi:hypothetical protein